MSPGGDHLFLFAHWSENIMMVTIWSKFSTISNFIMKAGVFTSWAINDIGLP